MNNLATPLPPNLLRSLWMAPKLSKKNFMLQLFCQIHEMNSREIAT